MSTWDEIIKSVGQITSIRDLFLRARAANLNVVEIMNNYLRSEPLLNFIGLEFVEIGDGYVKARFPYKREILRRGGMVHGGVVMTVIDTVLGTAVMTVNDGIDQYTAELKVHFLEPLINGPFTVEGRVIRAGRHLAVAEAHVYDTNNKLCALGVGTWFMVKRPGNQ
ncbi:MAG: PaaI family thioesterase [Vulcanisaeta sp.]|nr:PaaI family thioesterase [Vulcanisaeta sp.]